MNALRRLPRPRWQLLAVDTVVGLVVMAVSLWLTQPDVPDGAPRFTGPVRVVWLLAVLVGLPLAVRRLWPIPVLTIVLGASVAANLLDLTRDPYIATAVALYAVGRLVPTPAAGVALSAALVLAVATVIIGEAVLTPSGPWPDAVRIALVVSLVLGAAWTFGHTVRDRLARAEQRRRGDAAAAVAAERLRIARELHDIVSHSLSVIVVKAAVADHVAARRPEETRQAIRAIEKTGREALADMRRALGVLRSTTDAAVTDGSSVDHHRTTPDDATNDLEETRDIAVGTAPSPGLTGIAALARDAGSAGVQVTLEVDPDLQVPSATALTVYRIVQESLTNVVRHAGAGARCAVTVSMDRAAIAITVVNDGRGDQRPRAGGRPGFGLLGMRERVALYGGSLAAGPQPDGGFAVSARLPLGRHPVPDRSEPAA